MTNLNQTMLWSYLRMINWDNKKRGELITACRYYEYRLDKLQRELDEARETWFKKEAQHSKRGNRTKKGSF